jgi:hypothetical protein
MKTLRFSVQVRMTGDLVGLAKVLRVLKRYHLSSPEIDMESAADRRVTALRGTIVAKRYPQSLELALTHLPHVIDACVISDDEHRTPAPPPSQH